MKYMFSGSLGFFAAIWLCWPGVISLNGWDCVKELALDSMKYKTPLKAALATPVQYFVKQNSYGGQMGRIRVVGDACFR